MNHVLIYCDGLPTQAVLRLFRWGGQIHHDWRCDRCGARVKVVA